MDQVIKGGMTIKSGDFTIVKKKQFCIYNFNGEYLTRRSKYSKALQYVETVIKDGKNPDNVIGYGVATF